MVTVDPSGWSGTGPSSLGEARFKWWFDTVGQDASIFGTSVANAEFQIILEDRFNNTGGVTGEATSRDGFGELTFMDDFEHDQFTPRWNNPAASPVEYVRNIPGTTQSTDSGGNSTLWHRVLGSGTAHPPTGGAQSAMSDSNIGYNMTGHFVDMYVSLAALGNPAKICLIWATDIHNQNLDQAPNCDAPEETEDCFPDGGIPIINIDVDKTLTTPAGGTADKGDTVIFTINITNTGQTTLVTVPLEDFYDRLKIEYISASIPPNHGPHFHSAIEAHLGWDDLTGAGDLAPGNSIIVTITFVALEVLMTTTANNLAEVIEAIDENENKISGEDNATVTINAPPPPGDVNINKTLLEPSNSITSIGGTVTYSINITNTGSATLTTVQLQDIFDDTELEFKSATPNATTVLSGTITWSDLTVAPLFGFGSDLAPSASFIVNVRFEAKAVASPSRDDVTVTASPDAGGPFTDDDFAFVTILAPDVEVVKTQISPPGDAVIGDNIVFRIKISNTGGVPLVLVPLMDTYNASILQFVSADPTPNAVVPGTISWTDLTGAAPNGFNMDLDPGGAFLVNVTYLAIAATVPAQTPTTVNIAEVINAEDENENPVGDDEESPVVIGFPPITLTDPAPVGGYTLPVNNLAILTPYMVLIGLIGLASATFFFRKRSRV
jgi:uncharacterized repeat protein (TIGR01451 family)